MQVKFKEKDLILEKISKLPSFYLKEVIDFIEYLELKARKNETLFLSEKSLSKEWLLPEEEEAWKNL